MGIVRRPPRWRRGRIVAGGNGRVPIERDAMMWLEAFVAGTMG
jgi:hypothetical protein